MTIRRKMSQIFLAAALSATFMSTAKAATVFVDADGNCHIDTNAGPMVLTKPLISAFKANPGLLEDKLQITLTAAQKQFISKLPLNPRAICPLIPRTLAQLRPGL